MQWWRRAVGRSYMQLHSHLGNELREALEAIELLTESRGSPNPKVLGDFTIHHELGRGGMGRRLLSDPNVHATKSCFEGFHAI